MPPVREDCEPSQEESETALGEITGASGASGAAAAEAGGAARRHLQEAPAPADAGAGATEALVRRLVAEELGGLRQQVRALEDDGYDGFLVIET